MCFRGTYGQRRPDHPVNRAVWLQHLLSVYNVLDTVGTSIYIVLDKSLSGWAASQLIWIFTVLIYPDDTFSYAQLVPYFIFYPKYFDKKKTKKKNKKKQKKELRKQCRPRSDAANAASDLSLHCLNLI